MSVNDTQKMGAALSYAKRYALCAALNIIVTDEDDDAAKMSVTIDDKQAATIQEWMDTIPDFKPKPFFRWLEIESLSELPAANYDMVINELKRKAQEKGVKVGT
jgi:hypothetical protein